MRLRQVDMRHPLRSVKDLFSSKWFAIGMAVATSAWFFHVAALAFAPMSVVQAVLSTGVVLLAVMAERLFGFKVGARQWIGVGMTAGGLFLLVITLPSTGGDVHSSYSLAGMIAFEAAMLAIGALLITGPRIGAPDHHHGVMLGGAAGVLFGVSDVAIKALTGLHDGFLGVILSPWLAGRHPRLDHRLLRLGPRPAGRRGRPGHRLDLDGRQRLLHPRRHHRLRRPDAGRRARHRRADLRLRDGRRRGPRDAAARPGRRRERLS